MTTNVYVLKLADDCWYVGKAGDVHKRVAQHAMGYASAWTKLHKMVKLEVVYPNVSVFDEDKYTKLYMNKYGIDKVRGGSYVLPTLDESMRRTIQRELWGAADLCFRCGRNHFCTNCRENVDIFGKIITEPIGVVPVIIKSLAPVVQRKGFWSWMRCIFCCIA